MLITTTTLHDLVNQYLADVSLSHPGETQDERAARIIRIKQNHDLIYLKIADNFDNTDGSGGSVSSSSSIYNETPSGVRDGVNKIFTTQYSFVTRTTQVYKNTLKLTLGGNNDYIETGPNQITLLCILRDTDVLTINYEKQITEPVLT